MRVWVAQRLSRCCYSAEPDRAFLGQEQELPDIPASLVNVPKK